MAREKFQIYNVAVVLNNLGVDLLEQRCYEQALETFKDAITAMHATIRPQFPPSALSIMIEQANRRRARPVPSFEIAPIYRILSLSDNCDEILREFSRQNCSGCQEDDATAVYPIRIDEVNTYLWSLGSINDLDVQAAIVMHNMGLANLCLAGITTDSGQRRVAMRQSIGVLQCAHKILTECCQEVSDELDMRHAISLEMAVLVGLLRAFNCEQNFSYEANEVQNGLRSLVSIVKRLDEALVWYRSDTSSAPAA